MYKCSKTRWMRLYTTTANVALKMPDQDLSKGHYSLLPDIEQPSSRITSPPVYSSTYGGGLPAAPPGDVRRLPQGIDSATPNSPPTQAGWAERVRESADVDYHITRHFIYTTIQVACIVVIGILLLLLLALFKSWFVEKVTGKK
ncbi:hypothetical protein PENSPDRAFT_754687 [Peniophora sp. CONT]|nr:hypothetical protein PENSPDRAFT_754687 [Peniophora sp. CONT]